MKEWKTHSDWMGTHTHVCARVRACF